MKTQSQPISLPERLTQRLRRPAWKKAVSSVLLAQFALWSMQVQGAEGTWILNANGNWTGTPANWQGGVIPNGVGDIANFRNDISANRTVTLNAPITLGGMRMGDALGSSIFTFTGSALNTLTLDNSSGNAFVNKFGSATDVWQAPLILNDNTDWNIFTGTLDVSGVSNAQVSYSGSGNTIKNGAGALRLNIDSTTVPYTGNWVVNMGTLNIGGANSAAPTSLGSGTGGITLNGIGRADLAVFSLNNNGTASDTTVTYSGNNDVIVQGAGRLNVDRNFVSGANDRITHVLDNLTFNGGILSVTSGNGHNLRFDGVTSLVSDYNIFQVEANNTATKANLVLAGVIDDGANSRSIIKESVGRMLITNSANTYDGLTVVRDGVLELATGVTVGTGGVIVSGGVLSIADTATLNAVSATTGGLKLVGQMGTSRYSLPMVGYNGSANIDAGNPINFNVPVSGAVLGVDGVTGTTSVNNSNIDLAQVGSGSERVWLGNVPGFDRTYRGTLTNSTGGDLRLLSPTNTLILDTNANILGGASATNNVVFGYDHGNAILITGNNIQNVNAVTSGGTFSGGGTVSVRVNNDTTLGSITVNRGVTANINGAVTTPLGTGVVTSLGGNITTDNASAAQFGNTDFRMFGGSTLLLDNSNVTTANSNRRLLTTTDIDLTTSTLRLLGDGGAATTSSQTVNSIDYQGGSVISLDTDGATAGRLTTLTATNFNRTGRGTLQIRNISNTATTLGTSAGTQKLMFGSAPTVTNGMIGANMVLWGGANLNDSNQPLFATYDATHGVQAASFAVTATNAATLQAATGGQIVDFNNIAGTTTMTANATMQALRLRTTANTQLLNNGGFTITLGSTAASGQGAGLFLAHTADNEVTHTANFTFGGGQEGMIYTSVNGASSFVRLNGNINGTNGLTLFGDGRLRLGGINNFGGPLTINSGDIRLTSNQGAGLLTGSPTEINMWGGILSLSGATRHNNNITFYNDARLSNDNVGGAGFNNLTVEARSGSSAPVIVWSQNVSGSNINTAYGGLTLNGPAQLSIAHTLQINGAISGSANLEKYMNERIYLGGDSSSYSGSLTAYAGSFQSLNPISTAKPFGTGSVTINPGSAIRLAAVSNINASQVTVNSDLGGISTIGMGYVGDPAAIPSITINSTAPWKVGLGIGALAFNQNIDQSTLWGGNVYLGSVLDATGIYTGSVTPASGNKFLLGTGQGTIRFANPLTGAGTSAVIGLSMTGDDFGRASQAVNNSGGAVQYDVPMTYTGNTIVNPNITLRISARNALTGTGDLYLNGGSLQTDANGGPGQLRMVAPMEISNNIILTADSGINAQNNPSDLRLTGTISLAPNMTGAIRQILFGVDQPGAAANNAGNIYADGGIIDGAGGSGNHFIKAGAGTLFLTGTNTFSGSLTVSGGLVAINSMADFGNTTNVNLLGGGLAIWENSVNLTRNISMHAGNGYFDVLSGLTLTQDANSTLDGNSFLIKRGLGTMILNGNNSQTGLYIADGVLQVNNQAAFGNPAETGNDRIQFGGDQTIGGANNGTRYTGGTLRVHAPAQTITTARGLQFNNNGNTNFGGGVDVTTGTTFQVNGNITQGSEFDYAFITGAGTLVSAGTNTWRQFAMTNGTLQFSNNTPWANSTGTAADNTVIEMLGGTIRATNSGANIALANNTSTTTYNYGGGMHLRMGSGAGFSVEFAADNLIRVNQGTLVIETEGATTLGGAGASNAGRVIVTNAVNTGLVRASALNNGIFPAHLIGADGSGTASFLENDATTGFKAYSGASASTLSGLNPNSIASITADPVLTGSSNSIYAFRTTSDISGGTLKITAIDNVRSGGILINGSNTISSNLVFDPTLATVPGTGTPGEALIYVKTGESAIISGNVTSNAFTKFGRGTLTLSGTTNIAGDLNVQDGTLKLSGSSPLNRLNTELNINAGATLDLNGTQIAVESLGNNNRVVSANNAQVGGVITNSSGTTATLAVAGPATSVYNGTLELNTKLVKSGIGVMTLNGYSSSSPNAGNNTYTGGTDIYGYNTTGGINLNNSAFGFGGFNGSTAGAVNLYSGTLGLLYSNGNAGINNTQGQHFSNQVIKIGAEATNGVTLNVNGPGLVNVNVGNVSTNTQWGVGNILQVGDLNMSNTTLTLSGGNSYRFRVAGTTTITGSQAAFQTNSDGPNGALELFGLVTGSGAITKLGDGTMRGIVLANPANNYSGGTNIVAGDVQVTATTGSALGSGTIRVFPDGTLRIAANTSIDGSKLTVMSRINALGAVSIDNEFNPTVLNSTNFSSVYNTTLQLGATHFNQALNLATIGDGRAFLGSGLGAEVKYLAPTLGAGVADAWNPTAGVYRLLGGVNNLSFEGVDNVLTGDNFLQLGPQRNMVLGAVVNSGNGVLIRNSNNYTGGTQITEGTILYIETGGAPGGQTPLGSGAVEIYGQLRVQQSQGSLWNANTSAATNAINLRPGGLVYLIDGNINGSGGNFVAGDQGRWGDNVGLDLNGGSFRLDGAANWNTVETIGNITARKAGQLQTFRNSTASSVQLNVGDISRAERGVLSFTNNVNFFGIPLTTPLSYERLTAQSIGGSAIVLSGTTTNGSGAVNGGMVVPWIVDRTSNSFVGYDPTGAGTGFQPLISNASPGAGQIAYNKILSGALSGVAAGDIVDVTSTGTLAGNATAHALRLGAFNISPTAVNNTITLESGGLIMTGGTINPAGAITAGVVSPMTLNFGAAGAGEAIIYNSGTAIIQAQINAAQGLTKFGGGQLQIHSINPGITDDVVLHEGTTYVRVPYSMSGSPVGQVLNGQDVIVNGGTLNLQSYNSNAAGTATEIASNVASAQALFDSDIFIQGDAVLRNNGSAQYVRIADLTIGNSAGSTAMNGNGVISLELQSGIWVRGTTTLAPEARINGTFSGFAQTTLAGPVTGVGGLIKYGNGTTTLLNTANDYAGGTVIWGSQSGSSNTGNGTATSTVASALRGPGTPFGTGDIQIQPGGHLRIADNANIASNAVYLRSDGYGIGGIGIAHNGILPAIITSGTPTPGQIKVESTGPFAGVLSLDYGFYSKPLNMASIPGGDWWLGNSQQAEAYYFNSTLGASLGSKYLLGGGGNQSGLTIGSLNISTARTAVFENILSGGTAGQVKVEIGAQTGDFAWNSPSFVNGNTGFVALTSRNNGLIGDVRVNTNATLAIGNNFALGSGRLVLNGGNIRMDFGNTTTGNNNFISNNITLNNNVVLQGDLNAVSGGDLTILGNVAMSDVNTAGATRIWNIGVGTTSVRGVVSGAEGSNLIKRGATTLVLSGNNTYQGFTQIDRGSIIVSGNVLPGVNGPLGNSISPIILGLESANNAGSLGIGGRFTVGRDIMVVAAPGTGLNLLEGRTGERAVVTGGISLATATILTVGAAAADVAAFRGGVLDLQGSISGPGALIVGTTAAAPANGGTVVFGSSSNGYGTNTYSGGTTFQSARVQLTGTSYFTGPASNPSIISGPLGIGPVTLGNATQFGESNRGAIFEAVGGAVTIVNAFNPIAAAANTSTVFGGYEALTFTRDLNLSSDGTIRSRSFTIQNLYQPVTFAGNLSNSGAQGSNLVKNGPGMLILSGTNTMANLLTTDGNYGTGVFIDAGILRVNSNAALGSTATLAAAGPHLAGPADVRLRGGYLSVSSGFTTGRQFILTNSSGGIDVADGQTLTLTTATAGAFNIRKVGPGALALNNTANTITNLTLGGAQQLNPNMGYYSHLGGMVSTTAVSGTPFAVTSVTINSGSLSLVGGGVAQALSIPTITYGAAAQIALNAGVTTSQLTAATALTRAGAFNSINYGTLTINPSVLANLGSTEKVIVTAGAPANTPLTGGDMLTVPSIFVALAGSDQDANFARYDAVNGLREHNVTPVATLAATAATNVADITVADTVGTAPAEVVDVAALRMAANVSSFDGSQLLRINRGGLIFNGAIASTLSANTLFGTGTGSNLSEAIVYVRDGQTGTSAISGNITARDFTKTGPGLLEISGTTNLLNSSGTRLPVVSVQNGTLRFAFVGSAFQNELRGATIGDSIGHFVLNVNEAGTFDTNGFDTLFGGLTGNGSVTNSSLTPANLLIKNGFGVDTTFSGSINDGVGTVSVTKTQNGILTLNGHSTYSGGTTIQAGRVTNATGSTAVLGRLEAQTVTALGSGVVTMEGGTLRLNSTTLLNGGQNITEVFNGIDFLRWGGASGLDITVSSTSISNGVPLPANTSTYINAATQNAGLNNLAVHAPIVTFAEGLVQVNGTTTFSQDNTVLRTAGGRVFFAGKIDAAGKTITKTGANDVVLTNTASGANQNAVGLWVISGGLLEARTVNGGSNPFGLNPTIEVNPGTNADGRGLRLLTDGDTTNTAELVTTYANTNLRIGSTLPVSSDNFVSSGATRVAADRNAFIGNNNWKTIQINNLEVGGVLGSPQVYFVLGVNNSLRVEGTTTFLRDMTLQVDGGQGLVLNGLISGNGTLNRRSNGGTLYINADNSAGYNGGTFFTGGGRNYFGSVLGNQITLSDTAKLGSGHVFVGALASLQINSAGNLQAGQNINVSGNLSWMANLSLAANLSPEQIRLRSYGLGGIQDSATDYYYTGRNPASASLALGTNYTHALNMRTFGDGMWFLGSMSNGVGTNGSYDAATLAPGLADTYRLGSGGNTLFFGTNGNANVLTDIDASKSSHLVVGTTMTTQNSGPLSGGSGTVVLLQSQNYTGSTIVNRGSTLDFRGSLTTSGMEVYGTLNVAGEAGTFINPVTSANIPVTLRPGSTLRLDNTSGVLPTTATEGRWGDSTPFNMSNSILRLQGNTAVEVVEVVGDINAVQGTNQVQIVRGVIGRGTELRTPSITRTGNSTVQFVHNGSQLGSDERLMITGTAPTVTNGMVLPWMVSASDLQFLTYNSDTGLTIAGFDRVQGAATLATSVLAPNARSIINGAVVLNSGVDFETYALRLSSNVTQGTATDTTAELIINSGGLIVEGARTVTSAMRFGSTGTAEAIIHNNSTFTIGAFATPDTSGMIQAGSITKNGGGNLQFLGNNPGFSGDIRLQQGTVELNYRNTTDVSTNVVTTIGGNGGNIVFQGAGTVLNLLAGQGNAAGTNFTGTSVSFAKGIVLGDYVPTATIFLDRSTGTAATAIQNKTIILTGGITFGQSNMENGQILRIDGRNGYRLQVNGTVTLNGRSAFAIENGYSGLGSDLFLDGKVTGTGTLIKGPVDSKGRELNLRNVSSLNDWTNGTVLQGGTLRVFAKAPNSAVNGVSSITAGGLGNGAITLMQGVLDLRVDKDGGTAADSDNERVIYGSGATGPNIQVRGSSTINVDRTGLVAAGANKQVVLGNLSIGSEILTVSGGNTYGLEIGGTTTLEGNAFFNNGVDFVLNGAVSSGGGEVLIHKIGTGTFWVNSNNAATLTGPTYVNSGLLDWGNRFAGSTTANLGTGDIFVNPGASARVRGVGNLNTAGGQQIVLTGTPYSSSLLRTVASFTQAQLQNFIQPRTTTSNEVTYVSFEAGLAADNLNQSLLGDGRIYFGAIGDRTYSGAATGSSLLPGLANHPNAVVGGASSNRVYRLGHNSANTLTINLTAAGAGLGDVDGNPTDVQIGSLATLGVTNWNTGFVYFQDQNTYTGQTVVSRGLTLRFNTSMNATDSAGPLGANAGSLIDVYGGLRVEQAGSFKNFAGTANFYNTINLHPLSNLSFQDATATSPNNDRWHDDAGINLDGSYLTLVGASAVSNATETVGDLAFDRGSRIVLTYQGTNGDAHLNAKSVTRAAASTGAGSGRGTLVFAPTAGANLGLAATAGTSEARVMFTTAPTVSSVSAIPNMLPGFYVEGNTHRFVTYGANGVTTVLDPAMAAMPTGAGTGTEVVNLTAATTMGSFQTSIFALRGGNFALNSPTGANNDATVIFGGSGNDVGGVISTASTFTINPNLKFGADGLNEAIFYAGGNIQLNGNLTAGSVTKFGTGTLVIANDQSDAARGLGNGYSGGWVVNEGGLQLSQFGAAGNATAANTIVLNGSTASSGNLILRAQPADTLLNYTYTSGKIYAVDNATIDWDPGADDRVHTISDIEIQQSGGLGNAPVNGTVDAQLRIVNNRARSILSAGQLTITNNAILNVDSTTGSNPYALGTANGSYLTNGISSGVSVASLVGSDRLTKWGDGTLYVRGDSSSTFTGTMVIDQGAVHVSHNGSLGNGALIINRYGVLEVGVANYTPTNSSVTYNEGSIERWSVNNARSGNVNLGKGTLQIAANQPTTNATVTLDGGGIEAFLRNDDINGAQAGGGVMRILNPNVSITLNSNSFIGTQYYLGANGLDGGKQPMDYLSMSEYTASGAILEVQGVISGAGGLTKVGYDAVILSGNSTYAGATAVNGGRLLLGVDNALPITTNLSTTSNGVLDLNGQNQTVAKLQNPVVSTVANVTSGFITNSATTMKTLTVGNGISSGDNFTYSGVIQHNVALTKTGGADLTLNNVNTYTGATHINSGAVKLGANASINDSIWLNVGADSTFDVSAKTGGYTYDGRISGGGSADAAGTAFGSLTSAAKIVGNLVVGDHIGEICLVGTMSPGGNTIAGDISTAGNLIGHIQTSGDLTLSGQLAGSSPVVPVTRMTLQLGGATSSLTTLGYTTGDFLAFIDTLPTLSALSTDTLNGEAGSLSGHDYVKAGGTFSINANGRIEVSYLTGYTPTPGDVFNLLDWTSLTNTGFTAGPRIRLGGETNYDLLLPTLGTGQFWDTSLFLNYGTLVVIPEPGRALLMLLGLMALALRRRRQD